MMTRFETEAYLITSGVCMALTLAIVFSLNSKPASEEKPEQREQPAETRTLKINDKTLNEALAKLTRPVVPPSSTVTGNFKGAAIDREMRIQCQRKGEEIAEHSERNSYVKDCLAGKQLDRLMREISNKHQNSLTAKMK